MGGGPPAPVRQRWLAQCLLAGARIARTPRRVALRGRRRCNFRPFRTRSSSLDRSFHIQRCAFLDTCCIRSPNQPTIRLMLLAERLVGEARTRRARELDHRERVVFGVSAALFLMVGVGMATLMPSARDPRPVLAVGLVIACAVLARVRFEYGEAYVTAEDLILMAMLVLLPAPYVPLLFAAAAVLSVTPDCLTGAWHPQRSVAAVADSWSSVGPALVVASLVSGYPALSDIGVYGLAFLAFLACDFGWSATRNALLTRVPVSDHARGYLASALAPLTFASLGFIVALPA